MATKTRDGDTVTYACPAGSFEVITKKVGDSIEITQTIPLANTGWGDYESAVDALDEQLISS